ncbi:MAG: septum site-determining protein MinD [Dictyoglomus sp.]|nr:septum site-determining protein MinD [Dictyoglomus sp.]MCX7941746.1 septum site-determining protein MinD [Dictyoglomaceae bacterium]MDW8189039.1 septum site-determining protein MinD [Dictyoglomus sp.]
MGKAFVITSGKGGVGKTTAVANIGTGLAMRGYNVALVDTDIGLRNLDLLLGLENRIVYTIVDVAEKKCQIRQALIKDKRLSNLFLLPAAQTREKDAINRNQMIEIIEELRTSFDYILIDCPAGIEQGFRNAIAGADFAIVITTPEVAAVRDADRVIGLLEANGFKDPVLIINRVRPDMVKRGDMLGIEDVLEVLAIKLLGIIPEDEEIIVSVNKGEPIIFNNNKSKAGIAFNLIVDSLLGEKVDWNNLFVESTLWDRLRKFFNI